ncbi:hypothetical protein P9112_011877 [Eukaryota sp. TZLM1-RC]
MDSPTFDLNSSNYLRWIETRTLSACQKLSDRDTKDSAADSFSFICSKVTPTSLPVYISALASVPPNAPAMCYRVQVAALEETFSNHHSSFTPELTLKSLSILLHRLSDADDQTSIAVSKAIHTLTQCLIYPNSGEDPWSLSLILRPLFKELSDGNRSVQEGVADCLAAVFKGSGREILEPVLDKLCVKLVKQFKLPSLFAKANLCHCFAVLIVVCESSIIPHLSPIVACLVSAIHDRSWKCRFAAVEALGRIPECLGIEGSRYYEEVCLSLNVLKSDKIKSVRDSACSVLMGFEAIKPNQSFVTSPVQNSVHHSGSQWTSPSVFDINDLDDESHVRNASKFKNLERDLMMISSRVRQLENDFPQTADDLRKNLRILQSKVSKFGQNSFNVIEDTAHLKQQLSQEITEDLKQQLSQEITEDLKQQLSPEITEDLKQQLSQEITEDLKQQLSQEITEDLKQQLSQEITEDLKQQLSQEITEDLKQQLSQEITEDLKQQLSQEITEDLNEKFSSISNNYQALTFELDSIKSSLNSLDLTLNSKYTKLNEQVVSLTEAKSNLDTQISSTEECSTKIKILIKNLTSKVDELSERESDLEVKFSSFYDLSSRVDAINDDLVNFYDEFNDKTKVLSNLLDDYAQNLDVKSQSQCLKLSKISDEVSLNINKFGQDLSELTSNFELFQSESLSQSNQLQSKFNQLQSNVDNLSSSIRFVENSSNQCSESIRKALNSRMNDTEANVDHLKHSVVELTSKLSVFERIHHRLDQFEKINFMKEDVSSKLASVSREVRGLKDQYSECFSKIDELAGHLSQLQGSIPAQLDKFDTPYIIDTFCDSLVFENGKLAKCLNQFAPFQRISAQVQKLGSEIGQIHQNLLTSIETTSATLDAVQKESSKALKMTFKHDQNYENLKQFPHQLEILQNHVDQLAHSLTVNERSYSELATVIREIDDSLRSRMGKLGERLSMVESGKGVDYNGSLKALEGFFSRDSIK